MGWDYRCGRAQKEWSLVSWARARGSERGTALHKREDSLEQRLGDV